MTRRVRALETVWVEVPEGAVEAYEAALAAVCATSGFFVVDEGRGIWRVEGVREAGGDEGGLVGALAVAGVVSGVVAPLGRGPVESEGWVARTEAGFPEQRVGGRFVVRGTHAVGRGAPGRIVLVLDAGVAFGSGEHGSTRGCLRALEGVARRRPRRVLDLGTGSGILAIAAARLLRRPVLAADIDPWAVRVTVRNAAVNGVGRRVRVALSAGWQAPAIGRGAPYDLVFANILARPLCRMAAELARHMAPGGRAILAGLLHGQAPMVLAAHRRSGLWLERTVRDGAWTTLVLRR